MGASIFGWAFLATTTLAPDAQFYTRPDNLIYDVLLLFDVGDASIEIYCAVGNRLLLLCFMPVGGVFASVSTNSHDADDEPTTTGESIP